MTTRKDLIKDADQMTGLLSALDGVGPELSDKDAIRAICRCIWHMLDFLIRRTWGL